MLQNILIGIGDIHGEYNKLEQLLNSLDQEYSIFQFQEKLKIRSGVKICFTGDYVDRGPDSKKVIEYLMSLQQKNPRNVIPLVGNHELLTLGKLDYVQLVLDYTSEDCSNQELEETYFSKLKANFSSKNSQKDHLFDLEGLNFIREFGGDDDLRNTFKTYLQRMSEEGDLGKWIKSLIPIYEINFLGKRIQFSHADIIEELQDAKALKSFVKRYQSHLKKRAYDYGGYFEKYCHQLILDQGVFWSRDFRLYSYSSSYFESLLTKLKKDYLVVGHTAQENGRIKVYGECVFNIDLNIASYNNPGAIVFKREGIWAHYLGEREKKLRDL